jgi:hypothetical protein
VGAKTRSLTATLALSVLLPACGDAALILGELPGLMRIIAGVPPDGPPPDARPAEATPLLLPRALVVDDDHVAYIAERRGRILRVATSGAVEILIDEGACGVVVCPERIEGMAYDGRGGLVFVDDRVHRVYRYDLVERRLHVLAGTGVERSTPDGEPAAGSPVALPRGVEVLPDGGVLFSEPTRHVVRVIRPDGTLATIAGRDQQRGFAGDGGPAGSALLNGPQCLARRAALLFICDIGNYRVRAVDLQTGTIRTVAGSGVAGFQGDGGPALQARFGILGGIAIASDARSIFLADTQNRRVRLVHLPSGIISTYAGDGTEAFRGSALAPGDTPLAAPADVALTDLNLLYIADRESALVWRVSLGL